MSIHNRDRRAEIDTDQDALETHTLPSLWLKKIKQAHDDEADWRECAEQAIEIYEGDDDGTAFNILHSSIETLTPAIFNSTPVPDVRRRYGDSDPIAKLVVDACERLLTYECDCYDFESELTAVTKDALLSGRGIARLRYYPQSDGSVITDQKTQIECVPWDKFICGPARRWADVPWIAFQHDLTLDEIRRLNPEIEDFSVIGFTNGSDGHEKGKPSEVDDKGIYNTVRVFEIWDRETRAVFFICETYERAPLKVERDPLGLKDFFPVPRPLQAVYRRSSLVPVCPYEITKPLIGELDAITKRITKLVKVLKPRGIVIGIAADDVQRLADADDGELISSQDTDGPISMGRKLDELISHYPLDPTIQALQQLYVNREQIKQTIYEISGIADAMRGNADANKKLGQTQIETQWGSLRVQSMQRDIARLARDMFRMKTEVFSNHYDPQLIQQVTGLVQSEEDYQAFGQAMQVMKSGMREYRIDIETDSTVRADMTRSQEQMNLFINATAQFGNAAVTVGSMAPQAIPALIEIYTAFARKFQLGKQAEDALDSLQRMGPEMAEQAQQAAQQAGQPQDDGKAQSAQMLGEQKAQLLQFKAQSEQQRDEMRMEHDRERHAMQMQKEQADIAAAAQNSPRPI